MMDIHPSERQPTGVTQSRLGAYMAALLVLGAIAIGVSKCPKDPGADSLPSAPEDPATVTAEVVVIEKSRIPAADEDRAHGSWAAEGLAYLAEVSEKDHSTIAESLTTGELAALPFDEARGRVFELEGRVLSVTAEEYAEGGLLWVVVLEGEDNRRALLLRRALASDPGQGRPEDALQSSTEYIQPGDRVLARGIYLQRRIGTFGDEIFREPTPVLVATPSASAFRKTYLVDPAILEPGQAAWKDVKDRYLRGTKRWGEPALFQVLQWARSVGHDQILADIRSGKLKAKPWNQETFVTWSEEVESSASSPPPRPFTDAARGKLWRTRGLMAGFVFQGWDMTPREASTWGINKLYTLDIYSDHYGNKVFRTISAFPLSAYEGVTGKMGQHLDVYGFFLKNYTFATGKSKEEGGRAEITLPYFIVVHLEPVKYEPSPYNQLMWIIAGIIVVLALLFYFVLVRGERKEAARMQSYRTGLRRRIRAHEATRGEGKDAKVADGDATGASGDAKMGDDQGGDAST